jgi:hypothetical protein
VPEGSHVIFWGYSRFPELRHGVWLWWGPHRWPPSGIDYVSGSARGAFSFTFEGSVGMSNGVVIRGVYVVLKVCLIWVLHMWLIWPAVVSRREGQWWMVRKMMDNWGWW